MSQFRQGLEDRPYLNYDSPVKSPSSLGKHDVYNLPVGRRMLTEEGTLPAHLSAMPDKAPYDNLQGLLGNYQQGPMGQALGRQAQFGQAAGMDKATAQSPLTAQGLLGGVTGVPAAANTMQSQFGMMGAMDKGRQDAASNLFQAGQQYDQRRGMDVNTLASLRDTEAKSLMGSYDNLMKHKIGLAQEQAVL